MECVFSNDTKTCPDQEQLQEDSSFQKYKLEQVEVKLKRSRSAVDYRDKKIVKLESKLETMTDHTACKSEMKTLTEENKKLREDNLQLHEDIKKLHQQLQKQRDHEVINTMWVDPVTKKKCYTPEIIKCVYSLQESHVGSSHIGNCISSVLRIMTGRSCSDIPSRSTIQNWNTTRLSLAQKQLADEFSSKENTTLYSDETTKHGDKFMGYHASDSDKRYWVLGLRDIASKSAEDTLTTFKELMKDISVAAENANSNAGKKILCNI